MLLDFKKKKLNGFQVGNGYPWIINPDKNWVWIIMGIGIRVSMGKHFRQGMRIPDPYPTHGHPYTSPIDFFKSKPCDPYTSQNNLYDAQLNEIIGKLKKYFNNIIKLD